MTTIHPLELLPSVEDIHRFASDYRMSDDALFELAKILVREKPKSIIETGPGLSTFIFLTYFKLTEQPMSFLSVNEDGEWDKTIRVWLSSCGFRDIPISTVSLRSNGWYELDLHQSADLVVIDGPCPSEARGTRDAKDFVFSCMHENTIVVIDDTHRKPEKSLVRGVMQSTSEQRIKINITDTLYPQRLTTFIYPLVVQRRLG